ncbi:MAG: hypothetical protein P8L85_05720 [Rubripirellula sp.]|nr:hypothetical protein [Rubripirellula sp.]
MVRELLCEKDQAVQGPLPVEQRDYLMVVSATEVLRKKVVGDIENERVDGPSEMRLRMGALQ